MGQDEMRIAKRDAIREIVNVGAIYEVGDGDNGINLSEPQKNVSEAWRERRNFNIFL